MTQTGLRQTADMVIRMFAAILALATAASAATTYTVREVPWGLEAAFVYSFSDSGWVGGVTFGNHPFYAQGNTIYRDLSKISNGVYVSESGQAATTLFDSAFVSTAAIGTAGVWQEITGMSFVTGITGDGTVAGYTGTQGVLWNNGAFQPVNEMFYPAAISRSGNARMGQAYPATPYYNIVLTVGGATLSFDSGGHQLDPVSVNDQGAWVGSYWESLGGGSYRVHVAVGNTSGYSLLPLAPDRSAVLFSRQQINNSGQVIYSSYGPDGAINQSYIWDAQNGERDLSALSGINVETVYALNNLGQIVARSAGRFVILDPVGEAVPEPATGALAGLALAAIAYHRHRRTAQGRSNA